MHPTSSRQDETRCGLAGSEHLIRSIDTLLIDRENHSRTNLRPVSRFATVYDQEIMFYLFRQETLSNPQWYEGFNTKVDVREAIGLTRQYKVLLEYVAQELHHQAFATLTNAEQLVVQADTEERYISYVFLRKSSKRHTNLKVDLQNDFTTGDNSNRYLKNWQQTLHWTNTARRQLQDPTSPKEKSLFAQQDGKGKDKGTPNTESDGYNKKYWKDKECFKCFKKCNKMGHPASHCRSKKSNDDVDKSLTSTTNSVNKLKKDFSIM